MRLYLFVLLFGTLLVGAEPAAQPAASPWRRAPIVAEPHTPPVDAPIIDPFRPPSHAYGPGNRGLEYETFAGQVVRASGPGVVAFAGQVGGRLFITVRHSPSLVTTVGYLSEIDVEPGQIVDRGDRLGRAGLRMHFSARLRGDYIDPERLFQRYRVVVRLVADPQ